MATKRAVIFANGVLPNRAAAQTLLMDGDFWIAADGGSKHALSFGRAPDVLIGDLDSLSEADRISMQSAGIQVNRFPPQKNETDLELALQFAVDQGYSDILILAGLGGRTDQTLANLSLLLRPDLRGLQVRFDDGREEVLLITRGVTLQGMAGDVISLIPFDADAEGVTTDGLEYPLREETLRRDRTRGVSNRMTASHAEIRLTKGSLLCFHTRS